MQIMTSILASSSSEASASPSMLPFEIALVIFMAIFLGVATWTLLARRGTFDRRAQIPMQDDDPAFLRTQHGAE